MYQSEQDPGNRGGAAAGTEDVGLNRLEPGSALEEAGAVPRLLERGESILAVGSGTVLRSGRLAQPRWLIVVTGRRLLCIKGRAGRNPKVIKFPVSAIRGATMKGLFGQTLTLDTSSGTLRIGSIKKPVALELVAALESVMDTNRTDHASTT